LPAVTDIYTANIKDNHYSSNLSLQKKMQENLHHLDGVYVPWVWKVMMRARLVAFALGGQMQSSTPGASSGAILHASAPMLHVALLDDNICEMILKFFLKSFSVSYTPHNEVSVGERHLESHVDILAYIQACRVAM
jgi:hypothetical protein